MICIAISAINRLPYYCDRDAEGELDRGGGGIDGVVSPDWIQVIWQSDSEDVFRVLCCTLSYFR